MSGSRLSPKFLTVAFQQSMSSAFVHDGGALRLERAPSTYTVYLVITAHPSSHCYIVTSVYIVKMLELKQHITWTIPCPLLLCIVKTLLT